MVYLLACATMVYLLSESRLSIHTFVDEGKVTIDLFTCSLSVENEKIKKERNKRFFCCQRSIDAYSFTRECTGSGEFTGSDIIT